jgi:hypothetical protein
VTRRALASLRSIAAGISVAIIAAASAALSLVTLDATQARAQPPGSL